MYKHFFKRLLDIFFSVIMLPFLLLTMAILKIIIFCDDRGPLFYNAERLGKNGKPFKMFKFRTMKANSKDIRNPDGSTFNSDNDPRLTRVGRVLRKTSIDELPQIFNVLIGQMSFIGPRPDLPEHKVLYKGAECRKLEVRPGITGYSQAYFRNSISWKSKIQNDIYYIDHLTFRLDIKIFFKTIITVFKRDGIYIENYKKAEDNE